MSAGLSARTTSFLFRPPSRRGAHAADGPRTRHARVWARRRPGRPGARATTALAWHDRDVRGGRAGPTTSSQAVTRAGGWLELDRRRRPGRKRVKKGSWRSRAPRSKQPKKSGMGHPILLILLHLAVSLAGRRRSMRCVQCGRLFRLTRFAAQCERRGRTVVSVGALTDERPRTSAHPEPGNQQGRQKSKAWAAPTNKPRLVHLHETSKILLSIFLFS